MVATAIASVLMGIGSISGFANPASGDSMATPMNGIALATLLVGMLTVLSLHMADLSSGRASQARAARATDQPPRIPCGSTAGPLTPRQYAGVK